VKVKVKVRVEVEVKVKVKVRAAAAADTARCKYASVQVTRVGATHDMAGKIGAQAAGVVGQTD
jgi:hypothetical protein